MNSVNSDERKRCGIHWPAVAAMLLAQILVLLALASVVVRYLDWSSDTNQSEFLSASKPLVFDPTHVPKSSIPTERVKGRAGCYPKG